MDRRRVKVKLGYRGPQNVEGSFYRYEHVADIAGEADATYIGREFARLCMAITRGVNEGFEVASAADEAAEEDDET